ncbi:mCG1039054 [Mus musculus]|nr:mCG1039054 [Mus musculus]
MNWRNGLFSPFLYKACSPTLKLNLEKTSMSWFHCFSTHLGSLFSSRFQDAFQARTWTCEPLASPQHCLGHTYSIRLTFVPTIHLPHRIFFLPLSSSSLSLRPQAPEPKPCLPLSAQLQAVGIFIDPSGIAWETRLHSIMYRRISLSLRLCVCGRGTRSWRPVCIITIHSNRPNLDSTVGEGESAEDKERIVQSLGRKGKLLCHLSGPRQ